MITRSIIDMREEKKKKRNEKDIRFLLKNIQAIIIVMLLLVVDTRRMVEWMRNQERASECERERITNNSRRDGAACLTEIDTSS